jgi:DNA replication protein DnaC
MPANYVEDQIRFYAKHLRIPTFGDYNEILRRMKSDSKFEDILLEIMKSESLQRQENQNRRRLKAAGFPYQKTLDDLDLDRYNGSITEIFLNELSSCKFIAEKKNIVMIGNPGRGKTHLSLGLGLKACSLGLEIIILWASSKNGYRRQICLF